jgi:anti-sigma factor RsiW
MAQRRAGRTVKVSVSLDKGDVAALKRLARESHDGNLSAAFAEAARWIRQREARRRLIDELGGPSLTPEAAAAIDAEQQGGPRYEPRRPRKTRAA